MVTGRGVPLDRSDVDTDQIIPSDWLKRVERTGFGAGLFSEWRDDRDFVLNHEEYAGATILVAGPNFGTGSSREHAVWALQDYGFAAVVSPGFADIFRNNCTKSGLVPVQVDPAVGRALLDALIADPASRSPSTSNGGPSTRRPPASRRHSRWTNSRGPASSTVGTTSGCPCDTRTRSWPTRRVGRPGCRPPANSRVRRLAPARGVGAGRRGPGAGVRPTGGAPDESVRPPRRTESPPGPRRRPPRGAGGQPTSGNPEDEEMRVTPLRPHLRPMCHAECYSALENDHTRMGIPTQGRLPRSGPPS